MTTLDVSIIIINYNTRQMTTECINSVIEKTQGINYEIILVDNGSTDDSKEHFEKDHRVKYVYNSENLGFGKANNKGVKYATGKYLFFLNSDTLLISNAIKAFFLFMEKHPNFASCGANLISENGKNITSHGCFPSLMYEFSAIGFAKLYPSIFKNRYARSQTIEQGNILNPQYITGADIFIRHDVFDELNGFDDKFFMYYEETDLYKRMCLLGYNSIILPEISIIHKVGGSQRKTIAARKFKIIYTSKIRFWAKYHKLPVISIVRLFTLLQVLSHFMQYKGELKKICKIIFETPIPTDLCTLNNH